MVRGELLRLLSARLDHAARDLSQLVELLGLSDEQLIEAIGGRRRQELRSLHSELDERTLAPAGDVEALCVHRQRWRKILGPQGTPARGGQTPSMLWLAAGGSVRLQRMLREPVVAIVGSRRSSEYGRSLAGQLAFRLAAAGLTVATPFAEGIAAAALAGALAAGGSALGALPCGIDLCQPAHLRGLRHRLSQEGCLIAELPPGFSRRRWSMRASARTILSLAQLVIVVEAELDGQELELAELAQATGKAIAAVPGQVGCLTAEGPHRLIREGAPLIRSAEDALDLVYGVGGPPVPHPLAELDPRLRTVLRRVGRGEDTLATLGGGAHASQTLLAVAELEALGLLRRGQSGHYLPLPSALPQARTRRRRASARSPT
ncbi:MAG TPA: DNA-processing protein DprA [Solirubrobacteraceae bacterium]